MTDIEQIQDRMRGLELEQIRADLAWKAAQELVQETHKRLKDIQQQFEDAQSALYQAVKGGSK